MKNIYLSLLLLAGVLPETLWAQSMISGPVIFPPESGLVSVLSGTTITTKTDNDPGIRATGPNTTVDVGSGVTVLNSGSGQAFALETTEHGIINATAGGLNIMANGSRGVVSNFLSFEPTNTSGGTINIGGNNNKITTFQQSGIALSTFNLLALRCFLWVTKSVRFSHVVALRYACSRSNPA
jgi:hypothetical protein